MPTIKNDSMKFMKLAWSFLLSVTKPIVAKTDTFIKAKLAPTAANSNFVVPNPGKVAITSHAKVTKANADNMDFL